LAKRRSSSRLAVSALVFGPLVPHDCDLGCKAPPPAEQRARADRAQIRRAIERRLAEGSLALVDPRDGRPIAVRVPSVSAIETPDGDHAIKCLDAEAPDRESAFVCFTLARRDETFELVDISVRVLGAEGTPWPERQQARHSCPQHPRFQSHEPRTCPICGERLEPMKTCANGERQPPSWRCFPSSREGGTSSVDAGN
jgi:hypothetical protein